MSSLAFILIKTIFIANTNTFLLICNCHHLTTVITLLFRGRRRSSRKSLGLEDEVDLKVPPFGEFPDLSMIKDHDVGADFDDKGVSNFEKNIFCMQPKSGALGDTVCRITSTCDHNADMKY